ncbi:FliM/FliN family flagellar motor switch protein [Vampirovibrio sp.]|uniref:FliM/FliN family flagellar motor switch protein n=1 Tax=Vampirovibrio sp. TaxID=2717857 RepID=UPI003593B61B
MSVDNRQAGVSGSQSPSASGSMGSVQWQGMVQTCALVTASLSEVLSQFWGVPMKVVFLGISDKAHYFWRMDDFHVSQLQLEKMTDSAKTPAMALLRLSESLCATLLTRVLGPRPTSQSDFSFRQLSPLEATILNEFSRDLLGTFKKELVQKEWVKKPAPKSKNQLLQLVWVVALEEPALNLESIMDPAEAIRFLEGLEVGKIVLSLPANALQCTVGSEAESQWPAVPDEFFFHIQAPARIYLGGTRVALADLDHLEPEDIIVLDDSHISTMALIAPDSGEHFPFTVEIRDPEAITLPYQQEFDEMDTPSPGGLARQKLWDNLMIDVGAEFEPIKLPLKQIKQMSEGLVIEMGDLVHNRVSLHIEGKTLAYGELIIVGDKFGVRVSQVIPEEGEPAELGTMALLSSQARPSQPVNVVPPAAENPPAQEMAPAEEEMSLDNFLNEDFDETGEGGEEEDW